MILPQPAAPFVWDDSTSGPMLVCSSLGDQAIHLFTTRHWLLGSGGVDADDSRGWRQVTEALGADPGQLVRARQVHGAGVIAGRSGIAEKPDADILIGSEPGLVLAVQAADCVPLLVADTRTGAAAASHAGWRGLAARVPSVTVRALTSHFGSRPGDLRIALGPSIGACCYEVGPDVRALFVEAGFSSVELNRWFRDSAAVIPLNPSRLAASQRADREYFDGWACARDQLVQAGVPRDQIWSSGLCTASHPEALCSFRRDRAGAGRMAAAIRIGPRRP